MKNEAEVRIKKKSNFSDIQQVWTTRRNPLPFWGQRQCWGNIGKLHFCINNLKAARPPDVVELDNEQKGKFNYARMRYVALTK